MSKRTLLVVDLMCEVANIINSLQSPIGWLRDNAGRQPLWDEEARQEIKNWGQRRDRKLARLQATINALSPAEVDLIRRHYKPEQLAARLREVGATPRW
jgi:hypothetical protein